MSTPADNVIVTAIKKAEDSDAVVVRCLETEGASYDGSIELMGKSISVRLSPYAMGTVDECGTALDLMEWEA